MIEPFIRNNIEVSFYPVTYDNKLQINIKDIKTDILFVMDYFGYIQFNTNGRYNTVIKTPQNPLSFIGTLGGLINASYMFISTIFGLLYDKLLVFDIIAKFEGKIKKSGGKTSIKNIIVIITLEVTYV